MNEDVSMSRRMVVTGLAAGAATENNSVAVGPGATALTVMFRPRGSRERKLVLAVPRNGARTFLERR